MQRKLVMQLELTLDGFYGGPNGEMDWFRLDQEAWKHRNDLFRSRVGTVLLGRKNYQGFHGYWSPMENNPDASETDKMFSKWLNEIAKVVFSTMLTETAWQNSSLAEGNLEDAVAKLKAQPGKDLLIMNSVSVAQAGAHLVDEYWLSVHPVAIGEGLPLFKNRAELELAESKPFDSGQVFLRNLTKRQTA